MPMPFIILCVLLLRGVTLEGVRAHTCLARRHAHGPCSYGTYLESSRASRTGGQCACLHMHACVSRQVLLTCFCVLANFFVFWLFFVVFTRVCLSVISSIYLRHMFAYTPSTCGRLALAALLHECTRAMTSLGHAFHRP